MPAVKPLDRISAKWRRVASVSQPEYEAGIANPRSDWKTATIKATPAYEAGVQAAIQQKRFQAGVEAAGTSKWQRNALEKGPARWAEGINLSGDAFEAGFAPFRAVIERTVLPPRGPKGSPQNIQRVAVIANALHKEKMARGAK